MNIVVLSFPSRPRNIQSQKEVHFFGVSFLRVRDTFLEAPPHLLLIIGLKGVTPGWKQTSWQREQDHQKRIRLVRVYSWSGKRAILSKIRALPVGGWTTAIKQGLRVVCHTAE